MVELFVYKYFWWFVILVEVIKVYVFCCVKDGVIVF